MSLVAESEIEEVVTAAAPAAEPTGREALPAEPQDDGEGIDEPLRDAAGKFAADPMTSFIEKASAIREKAATSAKPEPVAEQSSGEAAATPTKQPADAPSPPVDPAATSSEGPSAEMLAIAKRYGVPQDVLDLVKSEAELKIALMLAPSSTATPAEPQNEDPAEDPATAEIPEELQVKNLLPADYVDPDDPLAQQTNHFVSRIGELQSVVAQLADLVMTQQKASAESQEIQSRAQRQSRFDSTLDALEWAETGKAAELKSDKEMAFLARKAMFAEYSQLESALPGYAPERLAELAYEKVFNKKPSPKKTPQQTAREAAIVKSSNSRLGGGYVGPPAAEVALPEEDRFVATVRKLCGGAS